MMETIELINQIILEDRTIANEVSIMTMLIAKSIEEQFKAIKFIRVKSGNKLKKGNFPFKRNGLSIDIEWSWIDYSKNDKTRSDNDVRTYANCNIAEKRMLIRIFSYNGSFNKQGVFEAIQHELSHLFERKQRGKPYQNLKNYQIATKKMEELSSNPNLDDSLSEMEGIVATIIYFSHSFEQRAFVNGAYQYLMQYGTKTMDFDNAVKETELYRRIDELKKSYEKIKKTPENDDLLLLALSPYEKLTKAKLLKIAIKGIYSSSRLLGRLKSKVLDDYISVNEVYDIGSNYYVQESKQQNSLSIEKIIEKYIQ